MMHNADGGGDRGLQDLQPGKAVEPQHEAPDGRSLPQREILPHKGQEAGRRAFHPRTPSQGDRLAADGERSEVNGRERQGPGREACHDGQEVAALPPAGAPEDHRRQRRNEHERAQLLERGKAHQRAEAHGAPDRRPFPGLAADPEAEQREPDGQRQGHRSPVEAAGQQHRSVRQEQGEEDRHRPRRQGRPGESAEEDDPGGDEEDPEQTPAREREPRPREPQPRAVEVRLDRPAVGHVEDADAMERPAEDRRRRRPPAM